MKRIFIQLILLAPAWCGVSIVANAADAPMVREVFICDFNSGKDMDDLMAARDYFLKRRDEIGLAEGESFVWTPFKVDANADFLWFSNFPDMVTFAREQDTYRNSEVGQAVQARFDSVATCTSSLAMRREIFTAEGELSANPAIISSSACMTREGVTADDLNDLWGHIAGVVGSLNQNDGTRVFVTEPVLSNANTPDLFLYSVQGSVEAWATRSAGIQASGGGPTLGRHFNGTLDCDQSLWFGQRVVPPQ